MYEAARIPWAASNPGEPRSCFAGRAPQRTTLPYGQGNMPQNRRIRATIKDIAKAAQVSPTAVSIVLRDNETNRVSKETKEKILEAARILDYRPNYAAKALVHNQSSTIGLIITTLKNPFYAELSQDIISYAEEKGYGVIASSACGIEDERRSVESLLDRGIDGLIICSCYREDEVVDGLLAEGFPFVLAMRSVTRNVGNPPLDYIGVDNERGAFLAVEHLIKMGHERIALLTGDLDISTGHDRHMGALAAFDNYGMKAAEDLILYCDFERTTACRLIMTTLEQKNPPTAVFAYNDYMAIGVLDAVSEVGARVPDDVAVVGFDDIEMAGLPGVSLSTVTQKKETMGRLAVDVLLDRIKGASSQVVKQVILDPNLIIRESCGFHKTGYTREHGSPPSSAPLSKSGELSLSQSGR